jgi:predicted type IV restriction endonuclease
MTLENEIVDAQECVSDPPKNESSTCDWIILPLLYAAGYARRDIESRVADSTGQFPDYTVLPNNSSTYYLEAKAWNISLEDSHVKQALNYANHNGKRFVVLTNGQSWRLYDNSVLGLLGEKLIVQAALRDTSQITAFLTGLSKSEVLEGSLERLAEEARQRKLQEVSDLKEKLKREEELQSIRKRQTEIRNLLNTTLPNLLNDASSEVIVLMTMYLSEQEEFKDLSPEILASWFDEYLNPSMAYHEEQTTYPVQSQMTHSNYSEKRGEVILSLKEIQGKSIDGNKIRPIILQAQNGTPINVRSWVNLAEEIVRWLLQQSRQVPIPFVSSHRTRYFLNSNPEHKSPDRRKKFKEISDLGKLTVYMDTDRSGEMFLKDLYALCEAMQVDPDTFQITIVC